MPRYRLLIEYDGGPYKGWQSQKNAPSVQDALQAAVHAFTGETVTVSGAGRTDTGVHATGQVAHVDLTKDWPTKTVREAMNAHLVRKGVAVLEAEQVADDFHARFSATGRKYLYRILDRRAPPALDRGRVWWLRAPLDAEAMHQAAQILVGLHDFTTFRDAACQSASPVKTLDVATVERVGPEVHLRFEARSFLHRQVRSMTGALAEVGQGRWSLDDVKAALAACDRSRCAQVAPPDGLYLTDVTY